MWDYLFYKVLTPDQQTMYFPKWKSIETPFFSQNHVWMLFWFIAKFYTLLIIKKVLQICHNERQLKLPLLLIYFCWNFKKILSQKNLIVLMNSYSAGRGCWVGCSGYIPKRNYLALNFVLCDSKIGYTGSDVAFNQIYDDFPVIAKIVLTLIPNLLDQGYCLFTDNFYTSPFLADHLAQRQTDTVCILRFNQKKI